MQIQVRLYRDALGWREEGVERERGGGGEEGEKERGREGGREREVGKEMEEGRTAGKKINLLTGLRYMYMYIVHQMSYVK